MINRTLLRVGMVGTLCCAAAVTVHAQTQFAGPQPVDDGSIAARLAALEYELSALRSAAENSTVSLKDPTDESQLVACPQSGGIYAGFAFVWAKPHFKEAFQATSYSTVNDTMTLVGYDYDYGLAPRVWLGMESPDGLGFRTGYWQYDHSGSSLSLVSDAETFVGAQTITVSVPAIIQSTGVGQMLAAESGLEVQTLDVEGTIRLEIGQTAAVAGAGLRYGRMVQDNRAVITDNGNVLAVLARRRQIEGLGPTLGADLLRPLGSGLAVAAGMRGSLLFGDKSFDRFATGAVPGGVAMDVDDFTFTAELNVGLQWTRQLGRGELALRGGYEGSFWIDAGEPVLTLLGFEGFALSVIATY